MLHRKRFGQHFLQDKNVIQNIVNAIAPQKNDVLVEIGPGRGALTLPLLQHVKTLHAIELDRDLIPILEKQCEGKGNLIVHQADALEFDLAELIENKKMLRVCGNLPYNISTPLIFHLLDYAKNISDMCFMLQKEVVDRLAAKPDTEHYGRLSVMTQYHCKITALFDVSPTAFFPQPNVISSIVRFVPYQPLPFVAKDYKLFETIVREAFNHRRKTIRNSLKKIIRDETWAQVNIDPLLRPETLSVEEFVKLSNGSDA